MSDQLADRVRNAVESFTVPALPAAAVAARIARAKAAGGPKRRPLVAAAGGVAVLAAVLAVAVPTADKWMTPAYFATVKRLTGIDWSHARSYEVKPMSLDEARRHTRFPIVVPRGIRVINATPLPNDDGISLVLAHGPRDQAALNETWADAKPSKMSKLEGVGIHSDGSIIRFPVRRWRIGRVAFKLAVFAPENRRFAEDVERATREAAATGR